MNHYYPPISLSSVRCCGPVAGSTGDVRLSFGGAFGVAFGGDVRGDARSEFGGANRDWGMDRNLNLHPTNTLSNTRKAINSYTPKFYATNSDAARSGHIT